MDMKESGKTSVGVELVQGRKKTIDKLESTEQKTEINFFFLSFSLKNQFLIQLFKIDSAELKIPVRRCQIGRRPSSFDVP